MSENFVKDTRQFGGGLVVHVNFVNYTTEEGTELICGLPVDFDLCMFAVKFSIRHVIWIGDIPISCRLRMFAARINHLIFIGDIQIS